MKKKKPPHTGINPQWAQSRKKPVPERKSWYLTIPGCPKPVWLPNYTDMGKFERWYDHQLRRNDCMGCGWCWQCRENDRIRTGQH